MPFLLAKIAWGRSSTIKYLTIKKATKTHSQDKLRKIHKQDLNENIADWLNQPIDPKIPSFNEKEAKKQRQDQNENAASWIDINKAIRSLSPGQNLTKMKKKKIALPRKFIK